jgi:hypothetical protein
MGLSIQSYSNKESLKQKKKRKGVTLAEAYRFWKKQHISAEEASLHLFLGIIQSKQSVIHQTQYKSDSEPSHAHHPACK